MEFVLLAKVGLFIKTITTVGYAIAGTYFARTGVRYFQDYKSSVEKE